MATGETHSVQEFCEIAFKHAGMELVWEGTGVDMVGLLSSLSLSFSLSLSLSLSLIF